MGAGFGRARGASVGDVLHARAESGLRGNAVRSAKVGERDCAPPARQGSALQAVREGGVPMIRLSEVERRAQADDGLLVAWEVLEAYWTRAREQEPDDTTLTAYERLGSEIVDLRAKLADAAAALRVAVEALVRCAEPMPTGDGASVNELVRRAECARRARARIAETVEVEP